MSVFRLAELVPDREKIELQDGTVLEFVSREEMSPAQFARLQALRRQMESIQSRIDNPKLAEEKAAEAYVELFTAMGESLKLMIEGLENDQMASLSLSVRSQIIQHWSAKQGAKNQNGQTNES